MKDLFIGFLAKTLNIAPEQVADLLYKKTDDGSLTEDLAENALTVLLQKDAERVQRLKPDTRVFFDNGYKKAEGEVSAKWEKMLRERLGVDPEGKLQGDALVDAINAALADAGTKPDKVKVSPEYLKLESEMKRAIQAMKDEHAKEVDALKAGFQREKTWTQAKAAIADTLRSLNPVLPDDQAKANRLIDLFTAEFQGYEYAEDPEQGFIPLKDGQRLQDAHGYARGLDDIVKERAAALFDFRQQDQAGNAGNKNGAAGKTASARFQSEMDYLKQYSEAPDGAAKEALYKAWKAQEGN